MSPFDDLYPAAPAPSQASGTPCPQPSGQPPFDVFSTGFNAPSPGLPTGQINLVVKVVAQVDSAVVAALARSVAQLAALVADVDAQVSAAINAQAVALVATLGFLRAVVHDQYAQAAVTPPPGLTSFVQEVFNQFPYPGALTYGQQAAAQIQAGSDGTGMAADRGGRGSVPSLAVALPGRPGSLPSQDGGTVAPVPDGTQAASIQPATPRQTQLTATGASSASADLSVAISNSLSATLGAVPGLPPGLLDGLPGLVAGAVSDALQQLPVGPQPPVSTLLEQAVSAGSDLPTVDQLFALIPGRIAPAYGGESFSDQGVRVRSPLTFGDNHPGIVEPPISEPIEPPPQGEEYV